MKRTKKTREQISYNMSQVKAKGSALEKAMASVLRKHKIKFRRHLKQIYGKPDFALVGKKTVVFCDSHFWHGYNWTEKKKEHKSNHDFWFKKIERNMQRDKEVNRVLKKQGWKVVRLWEHQIKKSPDTCINIIKKKADLSK